MGRKIRMPKMDYKIVAIMAIFGALFYFFATYADELGFEADLGTDFVTIFPGLFVTIVGLMIVAKIGGIYALPGMAAIGLGLAFLIEALYDSGYIVTQMMTGLTIGEMQLWIILLSTLAGGIIAAVTQSDKKW